MQRPHGWCRRAVMAAPFLALTAGAGSAGTEEAGGLRLLAPVDGAVVRGPQVLLVFSQPAATEVVYQLDGKPAEWSGSLVPGDVEDLRHVRVPLDEGRQEIRILRASDAAELGRLVVTFVPPHSLRTPTAGRDQPYRFHTREREDTCAGCHNLPEVYETLPDKPLSPAGKVCGACHGPVEAHPHLHGPVAVYACFMCHQPDYQPARFALKMSQVASCGTCHEGFLARIVGGKKYVHGPVAGNACLVCHEPHGGNSTAFVREDTPELCLSCHADTMPLPVNRGLHGALRCEQCHNPHGGETQVLTQTAGNEFCAECHPDVAGTTTGHPVEGHPVAADSDPARPGRRMECLSCHTVHAGRDISLAGIGENLEAQKRFCRKCHY